MTPNRPSALDQEIGLLVARTLPPILARRADPGDSDKLDRLLADPALFSQAVAGLPLRACQLQVARAGDGPVSTSQRSAVQWTWDHTPALDREDPVTKRHIPQRDLEDAMAAGGCPVCRLSERAVTRYLTSLLRERVTDVDERQRLRDARGLCNLHAWQLQEGGGALGMAIIYRDVVNTLAKALEQGCDVEGGFAARLLGGERSPGRVAGRLRAGMAPRAACPACGEWAETERLAVGALLDYLRRDDFRGHFSRSDGLCLGHFLATLERAGEAGPLRDLVAMQRRIAAGLRAELDEFIRKHDHRFAGERIGAEGDAWIRAIAHAAGGKRGTSLRS